MFGRAAGRCALLVLTAGAKFNAPGRNSAKSAEISYRHKEGNTQDFRSVYFNLFLVILPNFGSLFYTTVIPYKPLYGTPLLGLPVFIQYTGLFSRKRTYAHKWSSRKVLGYIMNPLAFVIYVNHGCKLWAIIVTKENFFKENSRTALRPTTDSLQGL